MILHNIILPVPDPSVSVTRDGGATLYAGVVLTLTCEITVNGITADMRSNIDVNADWTGPGGNPLISTARITINPAELDSVTTHQHSGDRHPYDW